MIKAKRILMCVGMVLALANVSHARCYTNAEPLALNINADSRFYKRLLSVQQHPSCTRGWRGIIPLRSTCEDVKRILGVETCNSPRSEYQLPNFKVTVSFSACVCCENWRVPAGTVLYITVTPALRETRPLSDYNVGVGNNWQVYESDAVGMNIYENPAEGVAFHTFNGMVTEISFYPTTEDWENLRCGSHQGRPRR